MNDRTYDDFTDNDVVDFERLILSGAAHHVELAQRFRDMASSYRRANCDADGAGRLMTRLCDGDYSVLAALLKAEANASELVEAVREARLAMAGARTRACRGRGGADHL